MLWPCTFHAVSAHFICIGYPTQTEFAVKYGLNGWDVDGNLTSNITLIAQVSVYRSVIFTQCSIESGIH